MRERKSYLQYNLAVNFKRQYIASSSVITISSHTISTFFILEYNLIFCWCQLHYQTLRTVLFLDIGFKLIQRYSL